MERLEYCVVGKGLGIVRRRLWLREKRNTRVFEKRDPCVVLQITPYRERKRERKGSSVQSNRRRKSISDQKSVSNP
jgi:hypothetical protein